MNKRSATLLKLARGGEKERENAASARERERTRTLDIYSEEGSGSLLKYTQSALSPLCVSLSLRSSFSLARARAVYVCRSRGEARLGGL